MARRGDSDTSRNVTDTKLRFERTRADEELLERSTALAETADDVIRRARHRARLVLDLARQREDRELDAANADREVKDQIARARDIADNAVETEYAEADAALLDENSQRRRAIMQLFALEREETDQTLASERFAADHRLAYRDELLGVVSHDLRSHLSALLMRTAVIAETRAHDAELLVHVDTMQRAIAHMDKLVSDLLDMATLELGRLRIERTAMDLVSIVADEVRVHFPAAKAHSIHLALDAPRTPIMVQIDPTRMSRVLMNVLTNALKFTPEGGRIEVSVEHDGNDACISVKDTGPGIPADKLEAIFERFSRAGTLAHGHGLGLYIARAIINAHGGRIWVESKQGEGSTFRIRLPAIAQK